MDQFLSYIGTKLVEAKPMDHETFLRTVKNEEISQDFVNTPGYVVKYPDGYTSWSPKDVFEEAYRVSGGMNFGLAIEAAKKGFKVARSGWNGADMYVVVMPGYPDGIPANANTAAVHNIPEGQIVVVCPYLVLKTAQDDLAMWSPSGSDALADDWFIL